MYSKGFRERERASRTAGTLVLALEGEVGGKEYLYFSAMKKTLADHKPHWLRIVSLPTPSDTHASAPKWLIERLDRYIDGRKRNREFSSSDIFWLVFDIDTWKQQELSSVCMTAAQKRYSVAASNPCFEFWLLLHLELLKPEEVTKLLAEVPMESKRSQRAKQLLAEHAQTLDYLALSKGASVSRAILRAEEIVEQSTLTAVARWPTFPGTFVYRLFRDLERQGLLPEGWLFARDMRPSNQANGTAS